MSAVSSNPGPTRDAGNPGATPPRELWLHGGVLACACPDCGAPMSIRVWLMVADCLHCGASIELTPEEQRRAERLLGGRPSVAGGPTPASAQQLKAVVLMATLIRRPPESRPA